MESSSRDSLNTTVLSHCTLLLDASVLPGNHSFEVGILKVIFLKVRLDLLLFLWIEYFDVIILIFLLSKTNIIIRLIVHINIVEINEDNEPMTISLCICVCMCGCMCA